MQISLARLDSDKTCMGGGMSDRDGTPHTGYADEILWPSREPVEAHATPKNSRVMSPKSPDPKDLIIKNYNSSWA